MVRTNQPIRQILHKPDLVGRMMTWAVELSQYKISYEPRQAVKAQALVDFVAEMTHPNEEPRGSWTIYVDGSSNPKGAGVGILIENDEGITVEYSLKFELPTSNNQAEYEACLVGIRAAKELGATAITLCSDSQLVVSQIKGEYQARERLLQRYLAKVKESLLGLSKFEIKHIPREEKSRADLLSKLASTKSSSTLKSVVEEVLPSPCAILQVENEDWRTAIVEYITKGSTTEDSREAKRLIQKAS
jgi:ribonuclease HI